jgi:hypothetical protein
LVLCAKAQMLSPKVCSQLGHLHGPTEVTIRDLDDAFLLSRVMLPGGGEKAAVRSPTIGGLSVAVDNPAFAPASRSHLGPLLLKVITQRYLMRRRDGSRKDAVGYIRYGDGKRGGWILRPKVRS